MAKIKINEKEFDIEDLSDEAKAHVASLQFVQNEIKLMTARIAVYKTAEKNYQRALQEEISNED
tara:strand:+ start:117 stop:308 length:192 start_codon:yes stop_codon:yes gene_type:complete